MSVTSANLYAVLDEESSAPAVGTGAVHLAHEPKVAKPTSSKKLDQDPRADPSRARRRNPGPPSNDRVLRENRNGGRANNKKVSVKEGQSGHLSRRHEHNDRHGGKRDTDKRVTSGWGTDDQAREDELAGEELAKEQAEIEAKEEREDAAAVEAQRVTLEQYLQSQKEEKQSLNTRKTGANAGLSSSDKSPLANATELKQTPEVEEPEARKKLRTKQRKEVQTLEPDFSAARPALADRAPRGDRSERAPRGDRAERGPSRAGKPSGRPATKDGKGKPAAKAQGKSGAKPGKPQGKAGKAAAPKINLASLPSLG